MAARRMSLPLADLPLANLQSCSLAHRETCRPEEWEGILGRLPNAHALQSWTWGSFKGRWGWAMMPTVLTADDGQALGAAMVLKRKAAGLPFSILYVPKGPVLDYENGALRGLMLRELEALARRERAMFIKIDPDVVRSRGPEPGEEVTVASGVAWEETLRKRGWRLSEDQIQFRNTVALDLRPTEETLLDNMKSKTRYNIRYAGRKGVVVREGTPDDFELIAGMYGETAERNDFAIRPPGYYLDAWRSFYEAGMAQPLIAEYEGTPLGAVIVVAHGGRAIYMYGASTERERNRQPNYLLQWEAIRWAKRRGCQVYDFWGAPDEFVESDSMWGVWRFKSGFGADVVRHIGAWDYAPRRFWYWVYRAVVPRYVAVLRRTADG